MTLAEDVTALQQRLADAQRARARAEGARDTAQAVLDTALAELKRDFGVDDEDQAEALLTELRDELQTLVDQISARLDQIGIS